MKANQEGQDRCATFALRTDQSFPNDTDWSVASQGFAVLVLARTTRISRGSTPGGDRGVRRSLQQRGRLSWFVHRRADECAVDEHRQLACELIGVRAF